MKKQLIKLGCLVLSTVALAACGGPSGGSEEKNLIEPEVAAAVKDAQGLSRTELMKKALEEIKAGKQVKVLAVTSRGGKDAAKIEFMKQLNEAGGSYDLSKPADCPVVYDSTVDGKIYTMLAGEVESGVKNYTGAILQDGYQLQKKFIDEGMFTNYVPKEWNDDASTDKNGTADPFTLQYNFKTWMYNNKSGDVTIDNVWDITDAKYKGKICTMDPANENVNMDWLIMLTQEKWADCLKTAFEASSNDNKSLDLTPYANYGEKLKYSYAFIAKFIENAVFYADDGKAVDALAKTPGALGWIVYSKIQNVKETAETSKKNITIAALGNSNTDGNNPGESKIAGFGGFMYKHYMSLMPNCSAPYATAAFFNVLSTTKEGYKNWAGDVGDYPTMAAINSDRTKNGHGTLATEADETGVFKFTQSADGENVFPCLNDPSSAWWNDATKGNAVVETPSFIGPMYNRVAGFINTQISKKK